MVGEVEDQKGLHISPKNHFIQKTECLDSNSEVLMVCHYLNKASNYFAADESFSIVEGLQQDVRGGFIRNRGEGSQVRLQDFSEEEDEGELKFGPLAEGL